MLKLGNRRFVLLMVIAVLAVASCVNDTVKEMNHGSAIDFRMATQTRAVESNASNIESFYVTARIPGNDENYFTDVPYLRAAGDVFISSTSYYWPKADQMQFYAYAPSLDNFGSDAQLMIDASSQKVTGFAPASRFADQKDFVVAQRSATKAENQTGIELQFEHMLSQIEVHAKNSNQGYVYEIMGVKIAGVASEGDFNFSVSPDEAWIAYDNDPLEVVEIYDSPKGLDALSTNIMGAGGNAMLIPQQLTPWNPNTKKGAYIAVYARIKTAEGALVYPRPTESGIYTSDFAWVVVPIDTEWQPGYRYIYTLDFSFGAGTDENGVRVLGDLIHFSVDELRWNNTTSVHSTAADFIGTWDVVKCESWRDYKEGHTLGQDYVDRWPPYDLYDTESELNIPAAVAQEMRRTRVLSEDVLQLYPGVDNWETNLGFRIEEGYLYITANVYGNIIETKYLIVDYTKNSFTIYSGEQLSQYYMEKIYYYEKVSDNKPGILEGRWVLTRGFVFAGSYNPISNTTPKSSIVASQVDPSLSCLDIDEQNNLVQFIATGNTTSDIIDNGFIFGDYHMYFTDVTTSTMMLKFDFYTDGRTSDVAYLHYRRID